MKSVSEDIVKKIKQDKFTKYMGIVFQEIREGYAKAWMKVKEDLLNFHEVAHGAVIFALADAAFSAASNSHGRKAVAISMNIAFRAPVNAGDELIAEAEEVSLGNKTALYNIYVRKIDGSIVAACQGIVYRFEEKIS